MERVLYFFNIFDGLSYGVRVGFCVIVVLSWWDVVVVVVWKCGGFLLLGINWKFLFKDEGSNKLGSVNLAGRCYVSLGQF